MNDLPTVTFEPKDRDFVFAVARRIVGNAHEADDVTQEALLLAYRHRDSFRGDSRYHTWLYRIAATTALGYLRRQRRSRVQLVDRGSAQLFECAAGVAESPQALIEEAEKHETVRRALGELAPPYRDVLLARVSGSEGEAAAKLGITIGNVKIRAHRARRQLRDAFERLAAA